MKKIYLVFLFFNVFHLSLGQSNIEFTMRNSSTYCYLNDIAVDKNDNIITTGYYNKNNNSPSPLYINNKEFKVADTTGLFLVKMNQQKEVLWFKNIKYKNNIATHVLVDDSSNVYLIGKLRGVVRFENEMVLNGLTGDNFIAKYTSGGVFKWAKKYVGGSDDAIYYIKFKPKIDNQGNLYIIGRYKNSLEVAGKQVLKTIGQNEEPYLLKLDRNGNYIWAKAFNENLSLNAISINSKNEFFLAGVFEGNIALNENIKLQSAGKKDVFYAKYDTNGQILWAKTIGGELTDECHNIEADNLGNIYLAGVVSNEAKFDSLQVSIKTVRGLNIFLTKIEVTKGQIAWVKNIAYGEELWNEYNLHDAAKFLKLNEVGEPYLLGVVLNFLSINNEVNFKANYYPGLEYFVKYDRNGKLIYAKKYDTSDGYDMSLRNFMQIDSKRNIYFSGNISRYGGGGYRADLAFMSTVAELYEGSCGNKINLIATTNNKSQLISSNIINNEGFNYQWYKNGEVIPNATQASLQTQGLGYYTLKLISKTNSSCELSSLNYIVEFPSFNTLPTTLSFNNTPNTNKYLFTQTDLDSRIEWYRDNKQIIGLSGTQYFSPIEGTYQIKKFFDNDKIVQESNEIIIKNGISVEILKSVFFDDGDKCKPVPYLRPVFGMETVSISSSNKFQWYLNGNIIKDSTQNHLKPITTGDYQVSVFIPSENKSYISGKYKIVIEDFPKSIPINKVEDNCGAKALLKIDDSFMQRFTFQSIVWRLDGKEIPNENYLFLNVTKSGNYAFSVKYIERTDLTSCTYNSSVAFDKKTDFKLNVEYAYAGTACVVDSFKVFVPYDKNYSYQWTKNDLPIKNQTTNELYIQDKSRYKSYIKRVDGCTNETDEISLKGCTPANSDIFLMLNPPLISAEKTSFYTNEKSLLSFGGCSNVNLQWLKDTQAIIGANKTTLEVKESGNYALQIEKLGCVATTNTIKISVETVLAVGEELPPFAIEVYPNPTEDKLFVSIPSQINSPIDVKLTNISGKLIDNYDFSATKSKTIDLKTLQEGVYFLVFETNGKRVVKKIIKKD